MSNHVKVDIDFMRSGFTVDILLAENPAFEIKDCFHYFIFGNKKILKINRFNDKQWETIVSPDLIMNPLSISKEEEFLISILPGVNEFDLCLLRLSEKINQMWAAGESETAAKEFFLRSIVLED